MSFSVCVNSEGKIDTSLSNFCISLDCILPTLNKIPEIPEFTSLKIFKRVDETLSYVPKFNNGPIIDTRDGDNQILLSKTSNFCDYSAAITRDYIARSMIIGELSQILPALCNVSNPNVPTIINMQNGAISLKTKIPGPHEGDMTIKEYFMSSTSATEKEQVLISIYLQIIMTAITAFKIKKFVHGNLGIDSIYFYMMGSKFTVNFAEYTHETTNRGEFPMIHTFFYSSGLAIYSPSNGLTKSVHISPVIGAAGLMSDIVILTRDFWILTKYPIFEKIFAYFSGPGVTNTDIWRGMEYLPMDLPSSSVNDESFMRYLSSIFRGIIVRHKPNIYFLNDHVTREPFTSEFDHKTYFKKSSSLSKPHMEIAWWDTMLPKEDLKNIEDVLRGEGNIFLAADSLQLDYFLNESEMQKFKSHPDYLKLVQRKNNILKLK